MHKNISNSRKLPSLIVNFVEFKKVNNYFIFDIVNYLLSYS